MPDVREEFEAYISLHTDFSLVLGLLPDGWTYTDEDTEQAWRVWQASRAALKVELPMLMKQSSSETYTDGVRAGWNACRDELQENLQQAGIEVVK